MVHSCTLSDCSCVTCNCSKYVCPKPCSTLARIQHRVRMPMSLWVSRRSTLNISGFGANSRATSQNPVAADPFSGPSDRASRSLNIITGKRGVDKKHNSYARYLGRKKAPVLRSNMKYSAAGKICSTSCCGSVAVPVAVPDPRPDYAIQSSSNIDNGVITVEIKNIGGSPAGSPYWGGWSFHRIFEVTTDIDKASRNFGCPAQTPFFVNGQSYYQTDNGGVVVDDLITIVADVAGNSQSYSVAWVTENGTILLTSSPRLAPNDSIKLAIVGTGFNVYSTYMFSADDTIYYEHCKGDETNEIIEDTDDPSNNFFVFTTDGDGVPQPYVG